MVPLAPAEAVMVRVACATVNPAVRVPSWVSGSTTTTSQSPAAAPVRSKSQDIREAETTVMLSAGISASPVFLSSTSAPAR